MLDGRSQGVPAPMGFLTLTPKVNSRLRSVVVRNGSSFTTPAALTLGCLSEHSVRGWRRPNRKTHLMSIPPTSSSIFATASVTCWRFVTSVL